MAPRRNRLKNLSLEELSVVDHPANQHAMQRLRKRHAQRQGRLATLLQKFTGSAVEEELDDVEQMADALSMSVADILQKCETPEELRAALDETTEQFKEHILKAASDCADDDELDEGDVGTAVPPGKKKRPMAKDGSDDEEEGDDTETDEPATRKARKNHTPQEEIVKTGDREAVLKTLNAGQRALFEEQQSRLEAITKGQEETQKLLKSLVAAKAETDLTDRAKVLIGKGAMPVAQAVAILKGAEALKGAGDEKAVENAEITIKSVSEQLEKSKLFEEIGGEEAGGASGDSYATLQKRANEIQAEVRKSGTKPLTAQQAFLKACEEQPDVYEQYCDEQAGIEA